MKRAFTLIELVVVVAILLILAAILFPVFNRGGHRGGRRSSCMSNLKQIGLGLMQYVQDYDDKLPFASHKGSPGWVEDLQPYLKSRELFQCPSAANKTDETSDYFINSRLTGKPYEMLKEPARSIMGGDGPDDGPLSSHLSQLPPDAATNENSFARRHLDMANYLFADGHVKALKPSAIVPKLLNKNGGPTFAVR